MVFENASKTSIRSEQLHELHAASLRLLSLLTVHGVEEELLQKGIESLTALIGARYGAIGVVDEAGQLKQFVYTGLTPEEAARIGCLPEGKGLLGVVIHENHALRLDDMARDPRAAGFPPNHPPMKSLLAVPVSHDGTVYGRVYLSEKTDGKPFTDEDEQLVARFAESLALTVRFHRTEAERRRAHTVLQEVAHAVSAVTGEAFFRSLVQDLAKALALDYVFVGEVSRHDERIVQTIAFCDHGNIADNIEYQLVPATACGSVQCKAVCYFPKGAQQLYPEDEILSEFRVEAFIGHPLLDASGKVLGLLAVMHGKPISDHDHVQSLLQICAARAASELERLHAEQALRISEEDLRALAENANDGILVNSDGRHVFANRRLADLLGYTLEELRDTGIKELVHPDEYDKVTGRFRARMAGEPVPAQYETVFVAKDGKAIPVEINAARTVWQGKPAGLVFVRDFRERKKAEAEMRQLASAVAQTDDAIVVTDAGGFIEYVNPAFEAHTGYRREEAVGRTPSIVKSGVHDKAFYRELWGTLRRGEVFRAVFTNRRKNGELFYEEKTITPLKDEAGKITHFVSAGRDITERIKAEQALLASERRYAEMAEQAPDAIVTLDLMGHLLTLNPAAERISGYVAGELVGRHFASIGVLTAHSLPRALLEFPLVVTGAERPPFELEIVRKDGGLLFMEANPRLIHLTGQPAMVQVTLRDITARKQAEDQIARLGRILDSSSNEIYVFDAEDLRFVQVNHGAQRNLGYQMEELKNLTPLDLKPEFTHESFEALIVPLRRGEEERIGFSTVHRRKDGSTYPVEVQLQLMRQETPPVFVAIIQDITERRQAETKLRLSAQIIEQIHDSVVSTDLEGYVTSWNKGAERLFGYTEAEALGRHISFVYPKEEHAFLENGVIAPLKRLGQHKTEVRMRRKSGEDFHAELLLSMLRDANGEPVGMIGYSLDITAEKTAREALRENNEILERIFDSTQYCVAYLDRGFNFIRVNRAYAHACAHPPDYFPGKNHFALYPHAEHEAIFRRVVETGEAFSILAKPFEFPDHPEWGVTYWDWTLHPLKDADGRVEALLFVLLDVTQRKRAEEQLNYLAYYDALTGLPNRARLLERLQQAMLDAGRVNRLVAVMFLDLDRFKYINDTLGHAAGDGLLKAVAERLKTCVRPGDIVARLGGDEFTVALASVAHVDDVARVARKIVDSFAQPFRVGDHALFTTTSVGITLYPFDEQDAEGLLKNADAAMYLAKERGRNNFQFFTAELNVRAERRLRIETALRTALERNELSLHYQPQVDTKTGRITGMEALLRWTHPELGNVSPVEFIPVAEETGLILPIGEWVLRSACRQTKAWHATDFSFSKMQVAVNISGKQLRQRDFPDLVQAILEESGLEARYLDLELTESLLMEDIEGTADAMHTLHDLGVSFSVDDFGTGYSSLAYLKRFPIDILKIDRSFVRDIATDPNDVAIVKTIIAMAHTLGMKVVAEGVETREQLEFLRAQACDGSQGYYCSAPLPAGEFSELLADWGHIRQNQCRHAAPSGKRHVSAKGKARGRTRRKPSARRKK